MEPKKYAYIDALRGWAILGVLAVMLTSAFMVVSPLLRQFHPSNDYAIYTYFAEAVHAGHNPYHVPESFRSSVMASFFHVGSPDQGMVKQLYADYPPALMLINSWAFAADNLKGLYWLSLLLFAGACILFMIYALQRGKEHAWHSLAFAIFLALNPLLIRYWYVLRIEDKAWFILLILLCLVARKSPPWLVVMLAIFTAIKGLGLLAFAFYLPYLYVEKRISLRTLTGYAVLFFAIVAAAHVCWFPDWIQGYQWRIARQNWVGHFSVFVPLATAGLYWTGTAKLCILVSLAAIGYATVRRLLTVQEIILLPVITGLVFNTELAADRLLVVIIALVLLSRSVGVIVAYGACLGLYFIQHSTGLDWLLLWGLTALLIVHVIHEIAMRSPSLCRANHPATLPDDHTAVAITLGGRS